MEHKEFYIDDWFQIENNLPEYEEKGICDDCLTPNGDKSKKRVKCVGWDAIYFCEKHWMSYAKNMFQGCDGPGDIVEPFDLPRHKIRDGIEIKHGGPENHRKSNC